MPTLNQIISDIRNISSSGSNPVEFKIEEKQVEFWINEIRAMLISQSFSRRQDINDTWVQLISCLELEQVDASECCNVQTGCYVLRTVREVPDTVDTYLDNMILKVTKPDGTIIPKSNQFRATYSSYNKFTGNKASWYVKNNKIYITAEDLLETINVWGIFDNPSELSTFVSCNGNTCFDYDSEYPCSLKMASDITNIVLKTKVFPFLQLPADNRNDGASLPDNNSQINTKGL